MLHSNHRKPLHPSLEELYHHKEEEMPQPVGVLKEVKKRSK